MHRSHRQILHITRKINNKGIKINYSRNYHYHESNIKEIKAPTDESIELSREIQNKIESSVLNSLELPLNNLKGIWVDYDDLNKASLVLNLNGNNIIIEFTCSDLLELRRNYRLNDYSFMSLIINKIAKSLVQYLVLSDDKVLNDFIENVKIIK